MAIQRSRARKTLAGPARDDVGRVAVNLADEFIARRVRTIGERRSADGLDSFVRESELPTRRIAVFAMTVTIIVRALRDRARSERPRRHHRYVFFGLRRSAVHNHGPGQRPGIIVVKRREPPQCDKIGEGFGASCACGRLTPDLGLSAGVVLRFSGVTSFNCRLSDRLSATLR